QHGLTAIHVNLLYWWSSSGLLWTQCLRSRPISMSQHMGVQSLRQCYSCACGPWTEYLSIPRGMRSADPYPYQEGRASHSLKAHACCLCKLCSAVVENGCTF